MPTPRPADHSPGHRPPPLSRGTANTISNHRSRTPTRRVSTPDSTPATPGVDTDTPVTGHRTSEYVRSEHVSNEPQEPLVLDFLRQYSEKNIMIKTPEAVGDVTLDEPRGPA